MRNSSRCRAMYISGSSFFLLSHYHYFYSHIITTSIIIIILDNISTRPSSSSQHKSLCLIERRVVVDGQTGQGVLQMIAGRVSGRGGFSGDGRD